MRTAPSAELAGRRPAGRSFGEGPPGAELAPDGSAVDLYAVLPYRGEAERVTHALGGRGRVLELGCGAGRVTRGLVSAGHMVTAVDNSTAMLARVSAMLPMVETVRADIETLRLRRRFDAVTLMSNLVNDLSEPRRARLGCCARHVRAAGVVLIERLDPRWAEPQWAAAAGGREASRAGVTMWTTDLAVEGRLLAATVHYRVGPSEYRHSFVSEVLDDESLDVELAAAGLRRVPWPDVDHARDREWVLAVRTATRAGASRPPFVPQPCGVGPRQSGGDPPADRR